MFVYHCYVLTVWNVFGVDWCGVYSEQCIFLVGWVGSVEYGNVEMYEIYSVLKVNCFEMYFILGRNVILLSFPF